MVGTNIADDSPLRIASNSIVQVSGYVRRSLHFNDKRQANVLLVVLKYLATFHFSHFLELTLNQSVVKLPDGLDMQKPCITRRSLGSSISIHKAESNLDSPRASHADIVELDPQEVVVIRPLEARPCQRKSAPSLLGTITLVL